MGYYVNAYGTIKVKDAADVDTVADIIEKLNIFEEVSVDGNEIEVLGYIKYYPEDYVVMYEDIADYVAGGEVEFTGDDNAQWKHVCEGNKWVEYDGEIQWVNPHPI